MRKLAIAAFVANQNNANLIETALEGPRWSVEIHAGGIGSAKAVCAHWMVVPEILILDVSGSADPDAELHTFAENAPPGETHLIVIGDGHDIRTYKHFREMGALEYLPTEGLSEGDILRAVETVGRAITARTGVQETNRVILVTSARGGAGASTIAAEIARGISSRHGKKTILVDLDIDGGCQHSIFNVAATKGFSAMLEDPKNIDSLMLNRTVSTPQNWRNLSLLSDTIPQASSRFSHTAGLALVRAVAATTEVAVVDLPARSPFTTDLIANAKTLIVVTPPTFHGLRETIALIDQAERAGEVSHPIVVVAKDGEMRAGSISIDTFRAELRKGSHTTFREALQVISVPYGPKQALKAANNGESLLEDGSPVGRSIVKLLATMPTAPQSSKRGLLSRIFKG